MTTLSIVLAMASSTMLLASGYLFGARRGRAVRAALVADAQQKDGELALRARLIAGQEQQIADLSQEARRLPSAKKELEASLQPLIDATQGDVERLRQEVRGFMNTLSEQERGHDALREELRHGLASLGKQTKSPEDLHRDIQRVLQPLLKRHDETAQLREMMRTLLAPMVEHDRLGKELSDLQSGGGLAQLPRMLDAISERGGFPTVVLSDDVGLPLAANSAAEDVDILAGMASFLLTLVERAERDGSPRPQAVVVHDASNRHVLHRLFAVDSTRFVLTAVSRGVYVAPGALDGALGRLERTLSKGVA